jgi:glycosyltransferase involved in cell wall biosynthesis
MNKVLFIGNFLSQQKGTKGIVEKFFLKEGKLVSFKENKILRALDFLLNAAFFPYQIIHIDVYSGQAFNFAEKCAFIAKMRKKRVTLTLRGGALSEFFQNNSGRVEKLFEKADYIQTPSLFLKFFFEKEGFNINYLPNPIDLSSFPYQRIQFKEFSLLWVRAFTSIYNPQIPIKVLESLIQIFPEATLTMIGPDKGELNNIKKLAQELNLTDKITFTGPIPNNQLYKYYQKHHVYLNTTSYESFGVAVVEAAACGIPIVSNNVGEIPFIWTNGKDILLVDNNDIEQYVTHISSLFKDDKKANELSVNARIKTKEFDWQKIRPHWQRVLEQ